MLKSISIVILLSTAIGCSKSSSSAPSPEMSSNSASAAASADNLTPVEKLDKAIQIAFDTVYFEFDSSSLTEPARANLQQLATALKANPGVKIQIEGHSDERGSNEYNLALGARRAESIRKFLLSEGIAERDILTASAGEEKPAEAGRTEEAFAKNRRGVFTKVN